MSVMALCQWCVRVNKTEEMHLVQYMGSYYWRCRQCVKMCAVPRMKTAPPKVEPLDLFPEDVEFLEDIEDGNTH